MSRNLDRALAVLDGHDRQQSDEAAYGYDPGGCWRCYRTPTNDVGLCDECSAWMRGETDHDPRNVEVQHDPDGLFIPFIFNVAPFLRAVDEMAAGIQRFAVTMRDSGSELGRLLAAIEEISQRRSGVPAKPCQRARYPRRRR